jgi:apolipoprotein D and lipocalin family protein
VSVASALVLTAPAGVAVVARQQTAVTTVASVDLDRYAGTWFEIARFPNRFQDRCVSDVRATYVRRSDGRIDVLNRCRDRDGDTTEAKGVARIADGQSNARLEVRFAPRWLSWLPMVWGDYWIIGLADDYSWATVGSPDRDYAWILSRTPQLSAAEYERAVAAARANGFDTTRLQRTSHTGM